MKAQSEISSDGPETAVSLALGEPDAALVAAAWRKQLEVAIEERRGSGISTCQDLEEPASQGSSDIFEAIVAKATRIPGDDVHLPETIKGFDLHNEDSELKCLSAGALRMIVEDMTVPS